MAKVTEDFYLSSWLQGEDLCMLCVAHSLRDPVTVLRGWGFSEGSVGWMICSEQGINKGRCVVSWEMTMVGLVGTGDANIGDAEYTGQLQLSDKVCWSSSLGDFELLAGCLDGATKEVGEGPNMRTREVCAGEGDERVQNSFWKWLWTWGKMWMWLLGINNVGKAQGHLPCGLRNIIGEDNSVS